MRTDIFSIAPKPVIAITPKQNKPIIFPNAANMVFFHPYNNEFVVMKSTAGPGVAVAAKTNVKYIIHN
jgi:hypothetical protein